MLLTKQNVDRQHATEKPYFCWDDKLRGFGLKVLPTGRKVYVAQYRQRGSRASARVTLGAHGPLTPDEARRMAQETLGLVAGGKNPAAEIRDLKQAPTVAALAPSYIARQAQRRKASTAEWTARLFAKYILPAFGTRRVADLTTADVAKLHDRLIEKPVQANRVLAVLSGFCSYAEREGHRPPSSNPCKPVERYKEHAKEHYLTDAELGRLGEVLRQADTVGLPPTESERASAAGRGKSMAESLPADTDAIAAIRLLLFTGCRKGEILKLKWAEVDLENGLMRLRDTKTGRSVRPLNGPACEILRALPRDPMSPFVFTAHDAPEQPRVDITKTWYRVREAAQLKHVRIHDFRHTVATTALSGGASWPLIGGLLGHTNASTTQRYAHLVHNPLAVVSERVGIAMAAAMSEHVTPITPLRQPA